MIQAYQIHRFFECRLTGNCHTEVSFKGEESPQPLAFARSYASRDFALNYIKTEARDWFLVSLEKYVLHKRHIITAEHPEQQAALKVCENALDAYQKWDLEKIAAKFLAGVKYFEQILPHHRNSSHETSRHNLYELRRFCAGFIQFQNQVQ